MVSSILEKHPVLVISSLPLVVDLAAQLWARLGCHTVPHLVALAVVDTPPSEARAPLVKETTAGTAIPSTTLGVAVVEPGQ